MRPSVFFASLHQRSGPATEMSTPDSIAPMASDRSQRGLENPIPSCLPSPRSGEGAVVGFPLQTRLARSIAQSGDPPEAVQTLRAESFRTTNFQQLTYLPFCARDNRSKRYVPTRKTGPVPVILIIPVQARQLPKTAKLTM